MEGSIARLGSQYALGLRARNCRTGDILDAEQVSVAKKDDVFKALSEIVNRFQSRAGESIAHMPKEPGLPFEVTTPSLEAWRSFSAGWQAAMLGAKMTEAVSLAKRATETDPQFAMAYDSWAGATTALGRANSPRRVSARPTNFGPT